MAHKSFDRIFSQAAAAAEKEKSVEDPAQQAVKRQRTEEDDIRRLKTNMTATDAIKRILLADQDNDYFRMLELPYPEIDALNRPVWEISSSEISKAYRKLSILVHPDKNPGEEARQAFEVLNQAHRKLKDQGELEGILKKHLDAAKSRREEAEARATLEERVALNAQLKEQVKHLRKQEGAELHNEILKQMKEKQEKARKKKEAMAVSRYRRREEDVEDDMKTCDEKIEEPEKKKNSDDSDDEETARKLRHALARRKGQKKHTTL